MPKRIRKRLLKKKKKEVIDKNVIDKNDFEKYLQTADNADEIMRKYNMIKTANPNYMPPKFIPRSGYWDECAQPMDFNDLPMHVDPRNIPWWTYISQVINNE